MVLSKNKNVTQKDNDGNTPLHLLCSPLDYHYILQWISGFVLTYGADPKLRNAANQTSVLACLTAEKFENAFHAKGIASVKLMPEEQLKRYILILMAKKNHNNFNKKNLSYSDHDDQQTKVDKQYCDFYNKLNNPNQTDPEHYTTPSTHR